VVATVHGAPTPADLVRYRAIGEEVGLIAISHCQRRSLTEVPVAAVIHHGIDLEMFPLGRGDGGYVAFLGRMSPDKGADAAIRVARATGRRIVLAAKMRDPDEHRWFREVVEPLLGADATFVGEVDADGRRELLGGAEALVNPLRWPEPFGLVMVEAAASGTPVLALGAGSAPEIVEDGLTGFVCSDEGDMAGRLPWWPTWTGPPAGSGPGPGSAGTGWPPTTSPSTAGRWSPPPSTPIAKNLV
jgi:glycosyltransferase involved in cell wall biosynthesis